MKLSWASLLRTINIAFKWLNANELNINRVKVLYKVYWEKFVLNDTENNFSFVLCKQKMTNQNKAIKEGSHSPNVTRSVKRQFQGANNVQVCVGGE